MERRGFIKLCAAAAAVARQLVFAAAGLRPRFYPRARLVDEAKQPLRVANLAVSRNYVFHYPFEGTPCFLLNLGKTTAQDVELRTENGGSYRWPGGVGANRSVVGYSAICTHRLAYPTRQISFISYRDRASASRVARANVTASSR
ncbi:MAG: twin-arginine translocation signal domain-containing protein [Betaproteobacteria bacterium]|nr:twin-arginine translocation signal domain-containing protein [Betaproteobacteria bacterium]